MEIVLTLTHIIDEPRSGKLFGFAREADGTEYFVSRAIINRFGLSEADLGRRFWASVIENPRPMPNRANQPHVWHISGFIDPAGTV